MCETDALAYKNQTSLYKQTWESGHFEANSGVHKLDEEVKAKLFRA